MVTMHVAIEVFWQLAVQKTLVDDLLICSKEDESLILNDQAHRQ